jgi:hypothetical protein
VKTGDPAKAVRLAINQEQRDFVARTPLTSTTSAARPFGVVERRPESRTTKWRRGLQGREHQGVRSRWHPWRCTSTPACSTMSTAQSSVPSFAAITGEDIDPEAQEQALRDAIQSSRVRLRTSRQTNKRSLI